LQGRRWLIGHRGGGHYDVKWLTAQGTEMTQADWALPETRFLAYVLAPIESSGVALYIILNAAPEAAEIVLPKWPGCSAWTRILATAVDDDDAGDTKLKVGTKHLAPAQSVTVFAGTTS
jgi:glycogen operon protein